MQPDGLGDIVPHEMQVSTVKKIFAFNVMKFGNVRRVRQMAWVQTGLFSVRTNRQRGLAGTTLGFAGLLMSEGLKDEAYKSTWGLYHVIYESKAIGSEPPKHGHHGNFRAGMYMRPTAIWALEMTPRRAK